MPKVEEILQFTSTLSIDLMKISSSFGRIFSFVWLDGEEKKCGRGCSYVSFTILVAGCLVRRSCYGVGSECRDRRLRV